MKTVCNKTDHEIRRLGFQVLSRELGVIGLLRFMQQFDKGEGNYVIDRHQWQQHYTVETLAEAIKQWRTHQRGT
jgi:hypothetical protein